MVRRDVSGINTSAEPGVSEDWQPASLARRFGALLIDWILCLLVSGTFADPMIQWWAPVLVLIFEYTFFVGLFGQTPGMAVVRIRCVSFTTGGPIGIPRALLRAILLAVVIPALIMDPDRRGLHDRAARSVTTSP